MTDVSYITKFERLQQQLYKKWSKGEKIILTVTKIKQLCEDYIRYFLTKEVAKELNNSD